jgi:hypothetical protein
MLVVTPTVMVAVLSLVIVMVVVLGGDTGAVVVI